MRESEKIRREFKLRVQRERDLAASRAESAGIEAALTFIVLFLVFSILALIASYVE